jgi:hypothetical protein
MTVSEFRGNPHRVQRLADILSDPTLKDAIALILKSVTPRIGQNPTTETLAFQQAFSAGVHRFPESLQTLATPIPEEPEDQLPEPFAGYVGGTLQSPEEIEAKVERKARNRKPTKP